MAGGGNDMARRGDKALSPAERLRWTRVGALAAFALVLSYVETFVPIPIPGVKLGLANIVVLVALVRFDARSALAVAAIKVLAAGLLFGSPIMMAYSAAGTLLAFLGMRKGDPAAGCGRVRACVRRRRGSGAESVRPV